MRTVALRCPAPAPATSLFSEALTRSRQPMIVCCSGRSDGPSSIPKLEPFSRSRIERLVKDPPFLKKAEDDLTEYCSTLEGDKSYSCWMAYFELKDLEEEMTQEDVEKFVRQAGGVKALINCLHGITAMQKKLEEKATRPVALNGKTEKRTPFPVPDGIPKSQEELEEEDEGRMPDSPFTRLLRTMGKLPAWYSQPPDHETD